MPIIVEQICQPTDQDRLDLQKIYQDYPFPLNAPLEQWLDQQSSKEQLWAGRFNDRLLVAATIQVDDSSWQLNELCVRKLTRRRRTASQFLTLLAKLAHKADRNLVVNSALAPDAMEPLLEDNGFTQQADFLWQK